MARRQVAMNEITEIIYQWHQGRGIKGIGRSLTVDRNTIRRYLEVARAAGIDRDKPLPPEAELVGRLRAAMGEEPCREKPAQAVLAVHRDWIEKKLEDRQMTAKQVWRLLKEEKGVRVGYCTVKRYVQAELGFRSPAVTVRMEVEPGSQAQVDFGYVGKMKDPETKKLRKTWAFILTLGYSRHRYVQFVFSQSIPMWIDCHRRAFEFFGGVPATVVIDNLKSGVVKTDLYDPTVNRAYAELERHYGFVVDPTRVATPKHKGKVERGVPVVRQQLLAGREFRDIDEANRRSLVWCKDEVGMEVHGTTKRRPWEVFVGEEAPKLIPLPAERFECPEWKPCKVHPDHHLVFGRSYYSVPTRYIGWEVWARGDSRLVRIFFDAELIKIHARAQRPGTWCTDPADYPPDKLAYLMRTPTYCRKKASEVGPQTEALIQAVLADHAMRNLRKAQGILRLAEKYGKVSMEAVAERALSFGNLRFDSLKAMLTKGDTAKPSSPSVPPPLSPLGQGFLRPPEYFAFPKEVAS
jgi:transposase